MLDKVGVTSWLCPAWPTATLCVWTGDLGQIPKWGRRTHVTAHVLRAPSRWRRFAERGSLHSAFHDALPDTTQLRRGWWGQFRPNPQSERCRTGRLVEYLQTNCLGLKFPHYPAP